LPPRERTPEETARTNGCLPAEAPRPATNGTRAGSPGDESAAGTGAGKQDGRNNNDLEARPAGQCV
jgi:hypothetical protein